MKCRLKATWGEIGLFDSQASLHLRGKRGRSSRQEIAHCCLAGSPWRPWPALLHNPGLLLKGAAILHRMVPSTSLSIKKVYADLSTGQSDTANYSTEAPLPRWGTLNTIGPQRLLYSNAEPSETLIRRIGRRGTVGGSMSL